MPLVSPADPFTGLNSPGVEVQLRRPVFIYTTAIYTLRLHDVACVQDAGHMPAQADQLFGVAACLKRTAWLANPDPSLVLGGHWP